MFHLGQTEYDGAQGGSDNTAHLKGKLNNLMDLCRSLHE